MKNALNRRELLALSGGAVMAATAAASSEGVGPVMPQGGAAGPTVVLQDRRLTLPQDLRARLHDDGLRLFTLEQDPVRMWRGEHAALLQARDTRLMGVTPWIEFVMIQGLAAESQRRVRYQRYDAASDAMVWLIA